MSTPQFVITVHIHQSADDTSPQKIEIPVDLPPDVLRVIQQMSGTQSLSYGVKLQTAPKKGSAEQTKH